VDGEGGDEEQEQEQEEEEEEEVEENNDNNTIINSERKLSSPNVSTINPPTSTVNRSTYSNPPVTEGGSFRVGNHSED